MILQLLKLKNKMKLFRKASFILSTVLGVSRAANKVDQIYGRIGLRALVLSTEKPESILTSLASYAIAYDNLIYNCENPIEDDLYLLDENTGNPKYNMIVVANGGMKCKCNGKEESVLKKEHWEALNIYEAKYNIRSVIINENTDGLVEEELGIKSFEFKGEKKSTVSLQTADNSFTHTLFNTAGIHENAPLNTFSLNYNLAKIVDDKKSTPVLYYDIKNESSDERPVAAVYSVLKDGNERLTFFMSSNSRSITSIIINHLWIPWASKNLYTGFRRVYLTQHIDDIFSSEELVSTNDKYYTSNENYRNTKEDFDNAIQYQNDILQKMPEGSTYRLELAFNGYGLIENTIYNFNITENLKVSDTYVNPKGYGVSRWPHFPYDIQWLESELSSKNTLYNFIKYKEKKGSFYWSSHGFTHQNLNIATVEDVTNQIQTNAKMAVRLGIPEENLSKKTIIPPESSGLHNVDAIETFLSQGITCASGNLYRSDITNDEFYEKKIYLPWRTTKASSNIANFPVIPRIPTVIFSGCSTPQENMVKFNRMHEGTGIGVTASSFDELLNRDSQLAVRYLLQLRHHPFYFHQSNLRSADLPNKKSLVALWTEKVLDQYNQYVKWPILSRKVDDINDSFIEREKFEYCDLDQKLVYNNTHIVAISLKTIKSCKVPIALPEGVRISENDLRVYKQILSVEQVNESDPITVWVDMNNSSVNLYFQPAIDWGKFKVTTIYNTLASRALDEDNEAYYFEKVYKTSTHHHHHHHKTAKTKTKTKKHHHRHKSKSNYHKSKHHKSTMNKNVNSSHNIITNIVTNIMKYGSITNELINEIGYTTEQLTNPKAFKELEKSRLYVEKMKDLSENAKNSKYMINNLNRQKIKYLKSNKK
ncbi:hypothetical protein H8356DRAFT_1640639 [Neocallimastix lanati (nom. inval.)]|nr:hypothetical protein H8356DRAFT_1640639 [Neocallimastix sp. JGI-2020a]